MYSRIIYLLSCFIFLSISSFAQKSKKHSVDKVGMASYYHKKFNGRKTATGELFDSKLYTGASNIYPLGTYVKVTNISNGKNVVVKINDRMAKGNRRVIDLTEQAATDLCFKNKGLCKVIVEKTEEVEPMTIPFSTDESIENEDGNK